MAISQAGPSHSNQGQRPIRWGILGPGRIARAFATALKALPDALLAAVGSRSRERAGAFAREFGAASFHGDYESLARDPDVDVVYVATPHAFHRENTLLCLTSGKAVLCEKPLGLNAGEASDMAREARSRGLFLMEGMWTRFLPAWRQVDELLRSGSLGELLELKASFGFRVPRDPASRLFDARLGGGALLDIGVYTVALASRIRGPKPAGIECRAVVGPTGVDEEAVVDLRYENGRTATLSCAIRRELPNEAVLTGSLGVLTAPRFWSATELVFEGHGRAAETFAFPFEVNGFEYEARAVNDALQRGYTQCDLMPLDESIAIASVLDRCRSAAGAG